MLTWWVEHNLQNVFRNDGPSASATAAVSLAAARNECEDAQICLRSSRAVAQLRVELADLAGPAGAVLPAGRLTADFVGYVPVHENTADNGGGTQILRPAPDFFPDPFVEWPQIRLDPDLTQPIWLTIRVPADAAPGSYQGQVVVRADDDSFTVPVSLEVYPFALPQRNTMWHTNWFFISQIEDWYRLERFAEDWWGWVERVAANMGEHRQNTILTPLFDLIRTTRAGTGYTFDYAMFDRWVETFDRYGVADRIEGGHLGGRASDWTSEFVFCGLTVHGANGQAEKLPSAPIGDADRRALLTAFLRSLAEHLQAKGWSERFILHQADEPIPENLTSYQQLAAFVREAWPQVRRIDAIMSNEGLLDSVEIQVPQIQHLGHCQPPADGELWSYVCLAPQGPYPNRFLDFALLKTRLIPWVNWRYGAVGYLHWGYSAWHAWGGCQGPVDPWNSATGASDRLPTGRLRLPPGDPHIVYPGQEKLCNSIRWEAERKGHEDYEYLVLLSQRIAAAPGTPAAEAANALLARIRDELLATNATYTRDADAILAARRELAAAILAFDVA